MLFVFSFVKYFFVTLTLSLLLSDAVCQNITDGISSLKLLQVIFRHGDRTPDDNGYNFENPSDWPQGYGQLTNLGKQHEYELGELLRSLYADYINPVYVPGEMYMRSTDMDRTLESAELVLAGLYPPQGDEIWNARMPWQPIPVHTIPQDLDVVLNWIYCPAYTAEFNRALERPEVVAFNNHYTSLYEYLQENSGTSVTNPDNVRDLYTTFQIMNENNVTVPDWVYEVYPDEMVIPAVFSDVLDTYTLPMKRLYTGPFLGEILSHMQNASTLSEQLFLYSAHDTNIAAILNSLDVFKPPHLPQFSSAVIFELHQEGDDEPYIRLWYRVSPHDSTPRLLKLPSCDSKCLLSDFANILKPLIPEDFAKECYL